MKSDVIKDMHSFKVIEVYGNKPLPPNDFYFQRLLKKALELMKVGLEDRTEANPEDK